jgi:hypothetical protein
LLTHITDFARDWGAPWAYSAFMFEDIGGILKRLFHGSKHISQQIFNNFLAIGKLRGFAGQHVDPFSENKITALYNRLDKSFLKDVIRHHDHKHPPKCLSQLQSNFLTHRQFVSVEVLIGFELCRDCFEVTLYSRLLYGGKLYGTGKYYVGLKRNNSIVQIKFGEIFRIDVILQIYRNCCRNHNNLFPSCQLPKRQVFVKENTIIIGSRLKVESQPPCVVPYANNHNLTSFFKKVVTPSNRRCPPQKAFYPDDILYTCVTLQNEKKERFCIVNTVKFENS